MLQCFVRGCKQAQVAAGTKIQDHDLNLEPVNSSTFFPFSLLHFTAVTFSKDKPCKPCKSLVSAGNGFLSTDSVYGSLLKISWQENLMILSTGWLKKNQGVPLNLNKAFLWVWKKASKGDGVDMIAHHVLSSDGLIARYLVIQWFELWRSSGCRLWAPYGRRSHKSVDLQHWLSEKSHQRSFLEET